MWIIRREGGEGGGWGDLDTIEGNSNQRIFLACLSNCEVETGRIFADEEEQRICMDCSLLS